MQIRGTIFDLKKFAIHDGPGIRTTVFFKGCPLDCAWCHNPEGVKPHRETFTVLARGGGTDRDGCEKEEVVGREVTVDEVMEEIEKDVIFYEQSGGGVTFSGGEPLQQEEFLAALLRECAVKNIRTAVDTSGFAPWEALERIARQTDMILYDLKIINEQEHVKYTGVVNKLVLARLLPDRINPRFESMFAIGVDEMSWDDLNDAHYDWPTAAEVKAYTPYFRNAALDPPTMPVTPAVHVDLHEGQNTCGRIPVKYRK